MSTTTTRLAALPLLVIAVTAAGCGGSGSKATTSKAASNSGAAVNPNGPEVNPAGDIPDNQAFVAYSPSSSNYSVKVPEGWARTQQGGVTTFTDKLNSVQMQSAKATAAPTTVRFTAQLPSGAKITTVQRTAGPALRGTYLAKGKADPVTGKVRTNAVERYLFHKGTTTLTLTLTGPKGADNVDPWKIVTDSVRWTR